jgi:dTDP-4-dehydrorhamnose reductase
MRILLTGSSGQVGTALRSRLSAHDVAAADLPELDFEDSEATARFVEHARPQLVINCAAYTAVDDAERDTARATQINATAPGVIAAAARKVGAGVIHFSTDYVFDGTAQRPYRETDPCAPINFYGRTKLDGEHAIAAAGCEHLIVRTSWLYGAIGQNFLLTMLRLGAEREVVDVVDDQTGSPTSAVVVAQGVAMIVGQMGGDACGYLRLHGGIVNMTCAGQTTWHGFATAIFDEARRRGGRLAVKAVRPVTTAQFPRPARRPAYSVLDLTRLRQEFHVVPTRWNDALRQVLDDRMISNSTKGTKQGG